MLLVQYTLETKDGTYGVGGLGAVFQPLVSAFAVQFDGGRNGEGVVRTDFLDETAVARCTTIGYNNVVKG